MTTVIAKFMIATLPYAMDALDPVISEETMNYHYGRHYQTYVDNLNAKTLNTEWEGKSLEEIVRCAPEGALFNNAGQALNHQYYFLQFKPVGGEMSEPSSEMMVRIEEAFGTFEGMQREMTLVATGLFGSGWVWLEADDSGRLAITPYLNADNPVRHGRRPLIAVDVWEHAYYLDWQNRRAAHVDSIWQIIDWDVVEARLKSK